MKKKGSHIDLMLSFMIFVGFLIFIYVVVEPAIKKPVNEEYILNNIKNKFLEHVSEEGIEGYNLIISEDCDSNNFANCFKITSFDPNTNARITSIDGEHEYLNNNYLSIECQNCKGKTYNVLFSEEFSEGTFRECPKELPSDCYEYKEYTQQKSISLEKVDKLKTKYNNDEKSELRELLGIPETSWFWFSLTDEDRNVLSEPEEYPIVLENKNIYSIEIPVTYSEDNYIKYGFLIIHFW